MVAVSLYDTLTFTDDPSGEISLRCNDPTLPVGSDNLVVKAADRLKAATGCPRGARIELDKAIPAQAGLAGGSSDAAATLVGLDRLWDLQTAPASGWTPWRRRSAATWPSSSMPRPRSAAGGASGWRRCRSERSLSLCAGLSAGRREHGRRLSPGGSPRTAAADRARPGGAGTRWTGRPGSKPVQPASTDRRGAPARTDAGPRRPGEPGPVARRVLDEWQRLGLFRAVPQLGRGAATPRRSSNRSD